MSRKKVISIFQECLESHSFGDYHTYHQQQQHYQTQQPESQPISCSGQCRHKNLSPVKDSKSDRPLFDRTASGLHSCDPYVNQVYCDGYFAALTPTSPAREAVRSREKNWRDKLERLEKMRCHYECRLLQLELMRISHAGGSSSEGKVLDVNRNLVNLRLTSDENSNVKSSISNVQTSPVVPLVPEVALHRSKASRFPSNSFVNFKQRSRSSEVDYCMRNLSARGFYNKKTKFFVSRTSNHQYYLDPAPSLSCNKLPPGNSSPSRRPVPKMGVRRLEESLHLNHLKFLESNPNGNSRLQLFRQVSPDSSVRPSRSFFNPDPSRLLYTNLTPPKSNIHAYRNENFISSPARYKVENGRIYRLPLVTKDVPKSEQLADCFQAFLPLSANHVIQNRFFPERDDLHNFKQPLETAYQSFIRDTNNNSERRWAKDVKLSSSDILHRRPWFGSMTQVDGQPLNLQSTRPSFERNKLEGTGAPPHQHAKVWEYLKDDSKVSIAADTFDNYVEWLTKNHTKCFYENLKSVPKRRTDGQTNSKFSSIHLPEAPNRYLACHLSNQTNSDFEGCPKNARMPVRSTKDFLWRDSEESDNDYVKIDGLIPTPHPIGNQSTPESSSTKKKEPSRCGSRKSMKKKQLLRERAKKLAEERNSRNSSKNQESSTSGGNTPKSKSHSSKKWFEKRKIRQKGSTLVTDMKIQECDLYSDEAHLHYTSDNEEGSFENIPTENHYSTLAEYESLSNLSFDIDDVDSEDRNFVPFVRPKNSPSMTTV